MHRFHIEVILPVFNEVRNILPLLKKFDAVKNTLSEQAYLTFLFINDGSTDGTGELLHQLFREREDIRIIDLIHNFGHSAAISCGIDHFEGDVAVLMDADLQDDPGSLTTMFEAWKAGAKTVVAERASRSEKNRILFKAFYYLFHRFHRRFPPIDFGTHSLLDRSVVERVRLLKERNRYFPGLVHYSSGKIHAIPMDRAARASGKSRVGTWGLVNLAVTALLSFSSTPVRLVSLIGLISSGFGFIIGLMVIYEKLFTTKAIPGWASTIAGISFTSGIQLLCLGIIGEYMARIYEEVKQRPSYLVERELNKKQKAGKKDAA